MAIEICICRRCCEGMDVGIAGKMRQGVRNVAGATMGRANIDARIAMEVVLRATNALLNRMHPVLCTV